MNDKSKTYFAPADICARDLVRAYRLYHEMVRYPHLLKQIRQLFLSVLCERGIVCVDSIRQDAAEQMESLSETSNENSFEDLMAALIDIYFARHFTWEEIENYINLARKRDAFNSLNRVLSSDESTWQDVRTAVQEFCGISQGSLYISPDEAIGARVALISRFISDQLPFIGIAKHHITVRDLNDLMGQIFWNPRRRGRIGGKAAGMFLAYKILLPRLEERNPNFEKYVRIPESYYFNSGFLTDFLDSNNLFSFHSLKYKNRETIEEEFDKITQTIEKGVFPADVVLQFRGFLERIGEHPLIIRSSSLLEDNFGHTFSGKYDSVFIVNEGEIELRLNEFIRALKQVLISVFSPKAILYRRDHNLLDFDERMSVLVQKVVGRRYGRYFFPAAAGVAFSKNVYSWTPRIDKNDGLLRLVFGLGTRAVDRIGADYTRMVPLSHPLLRPEVSAAEITKYSQKLVDVLDMESRSIQSIPAVDLLRKVDHPDLFYTVSVNREGHLAAPLFRSQEIDVVHSCITFDNLLSKTAIAELMKKMLHRLEEAYGRPVEVEFAWEGGKLYLLQCRTLAAGRLVEKVNLPVNVPPERLLFTCGRCLTSSVVRNIEYVVYMNPRAYARLATQDERLEAGRTVRRINRLLENKVYALFGPARWGTNDIQLGIKVGYEDINRTRILAEVAFEELGSTPEPSFGTHFFNDLVEADIVPVAIYPDQPGGVFKEDFFLNCPSVLKSLAPELDDLGGLARVIHVPSCTRGLLLQIYLSGDEQEGMGFFGHADEKF